jgi:hypothetical protein
MRAPESQGAGPCPQSDGAPNAARAAAEAGAAAEGGEVTGWIGVDLDGTLAHYEGWQGLAHIGPPVPRMVARVKGWLAAGRDVRIVTARVSHNGTAASMVAAQIALIHVMRWCAVHLGTELPVTCTKDYAMLELWDDRAVQVVPNVGLRADGQEETP